jgi:hypothetical protein
MMATCSSGHAVRRGLRECLRWLSFHFADGRARAAIAVLALIGGLPEVAEVGINRSKGSVPLQHKFRSPKSTRAQLETDCNFRSGKICEGQKDISPEQVDRHCGA